MDRMAGKDGLNLIKVKKDVLMQKLLDNKKSHVQEYKKAVEGFKQSVVDELQRYLDRAIEGKRIKTYIQFDEPECHDADYDTVIEMLEMSVDEEVYLTTPQFKHYVQDQWTWKEGFSLTNSKYIN